MAVAEGHYVAQRRRQTELERVVERSPEMMIMARRLVRTSVAALFVGALLVPASPSLADTEAAQWTKQAPVPTWYNLAGVYVELDNPQVSDYNTIDAAIQCYLRTLELDPKHLEGSFKLMELALNHKKSDLAIKVMEDAVEHNADEPLAYYNLISVYDKCKMFEQAEQARQRLKERFAKRSKTSAS